MAEEDYKKIKAKCKELNRPWINEPPSYTHFRIWDIKHKTWCGWQDENTLPYYGFDPFCGEVVTMQKWPLDWHEYEWLRVDQSTGIADRNGVEIYQRDIVAFDYHRGHGEELFEVIFDTQEARFSLKPLGISRDRKETWEEEKRLRVDFFDYNDPTEEFEVIGAKGLATDF